jgi:hypothetical protein
VIKASFNFFRHPIRGAVVENEPLTKSPPAYMLYWELTSESIRLRRDGLFTLDHVRTILPGKAGTSALAKLVELGFVAADGEQSWRLVRFAHEQLTVAEREAKSAQGRKAVASRQDRCGVSSPDCSRILPGSSADVSETNDEINPECLSVSVENHSGDELLPVELAVVQNAYSLKASGIRSEISADRPPTVVSSPTPVAPATVPAVEAQDHEPIQSSLALTASEPAAPSAPKPRKRAGKGPVKAQNPSDHAAVIAAFHDAFVAACGVPPIIGSKEGGAAKRLLQAMPAADAVALVHTAFADTWFAANTKDLAAIAANPNKFRGKSAAPVSKFKRPVQQEYSPPPRRIDDEFTSDQKRALQRILDAQDTFAREFPFVDEDHGEPYAPMAKLRAEYKALRDAAVAEAEARRTSERNRGTFLIVRAS